jgi:hypothetical protein
MKAVVRNAYDLAGTLYTNGNNSNGNNIEGLEMDLLRIILKQMNMTFVHVPTPRGFEIEEGSVNNLVNVMIAKKACIALGSVIRNFFFYTSFDLTNTYFTTRFRWYVPCFEKYSRWSSIFRIFSAELWLVLIVSIVSVAISTTHFGRYSCTSEWQVYKTLSSSLTHVWAVILGVSVSTKPRTPSLRSLFLAWVCFSVAFSTVFQAFLTTFLIDSGYKTSIQNKEELYASGIKLAFNSDYSFTLETDDEDELSKVRSNLANCIWFWDCLDWAIYQKNVSMLLPDSEAEYLFAFGFFVDENSKPFFCGLEDGVIFPYSRTMMMFPGDPLMRRVNEIIDRVIEAGLYNYWHSKEINFDKILFEKVRNIEQFDEYYSFKLYHMQSAFYLLLMGWCISALCFTFEVLHHRVLSKRG